MWLYLRIVRTTCYEPLLPHQDGGWYVHGREDLTIITITWHLVKTLGIQCGGRCATAQLMKQVTEQVLVNAAGVTSVSKFLVLGSEW